MSIRCQNCLSEYPANPSNQFCSNCGVALSVAKSAVVNPTPQHSNYSGNDFMPRAVPPMSNHRRSLRDYLPKPQILAIALVGSLIVVGSKVISLLASHTSNQASTISQPIGVQTTYPLSTHLHIFYNGDQWTYALSGTLTDPQGNVTALDNGKVTTSIGNLTWNKLPTYEETTQITASLRIRSRDEPLSSTIHRVISQDVNSGQTYLIRDDQGKNSSRRNVLDRTIDSIGSWSSNSQLSQLIRYDDGETEQTNMQVLGTENVDTAIGRFAAWKTITTTTKATGNKSILTNWFVPALGAPVVTELETTSNMGVRIKMHLTLVNTTVPR